MKRYKFRISFTVKFTEKPLASKLTVTGTD